MKGKLKLHICRLLTVGLVLGQSACAVASESYLLLPVKPGNPEKVFTLHYKGSVIRHGKIEWADGEVAFKLGIDVTGLDVDALDLMLDNRSVAPEISARIPGGENLYTEPARPQLHFTAPRGWLNDPNGLVWHQGEWHLFYQHNPYGTKWGNMHWGHAVSRDLLHWEHLPIAIFPEYSEAMTDWAFSGSAFFDTNNSLGLAEGPALVAAYTSTGRGECLAYSHDRGRTWTDFTVNPVLVHGDSNKGTPGETGFWHDSRDPKIFRYTGGNSDHWVMVVYEQNEQEKKNRENITLAIYSSDNLRDWTRTQVLQGWYECPELFPLEDPHGDGRKWVLMGAHGYYKIGDFDGRIFTADPRDGDSHPVKNDFRPYIEDPEKYHGPYGNGYAGQCWNGVPEGDGRILYISWVHTQSPEGSCWNQAMGLPVQLSLKDGHRGLRLHFEPMRELEKLHGATLLDGFSGNGEELEEALATAVPKCFRLKGLLSVDDLKTSTLSIHGRDFAFDPETGVFGDMPIGLPDEGKLVIELIADQGLIELFVEGGLFYGVYAHTFEDGQEGIILDNACFENVDLMELNSVW